MQRAYPSLFVSFIQFHEKLHVSKNLYFPTSDQKISNENRAQEAKFVDEENRKDFLHEVLALLSGLLYVSSIV